MSLQTISYLKGQFSCKKRPTQKDYADLIDTLAYLPIDFCDKTPLFNIITECSTNGITVDGSIYINNTLSAAEVMFNNLSTNQISCDNTSTVNLTTSNITMLNATLTAVNNIDSGMCLSISINNSSFLIPLYQYYTGI